jgi:hypothetical protein
LIDAQGRKSERAEARFDFFVGNVGTHHAKKFRAG